MTHEPVMLKEVLSFLNFSDLKNFENLKIVDGTLGLGGYSEAVLDAFPAAHVWGIDRDPEALSLSRARLAPYASRFRALHSNFGGLDRALKADAPFNAFMFDLGVSNMQLTEKDRGFSFQNDGPLDMRMDQPGDAPTASEVLARTDARELARIFREYGGEKYAGQIASAIERHRQRGGRLETTGELVALIRGLLPEPVQRKMGGHPARRVFQALRIFVNDELGELEAMLAHLPGLAAAGCVVVIVSYHSLEDRIVKHCFRSWEREKNFGKVLTKHPVLPSPEETGRNYKSRSAKLRAFRFE